MLACCLGGKGYKRPIEYDDEDDEGLVWGVKDEDVETGRV